MLTFEEALSVAIAAREERLAKFEKYGAEMWAEPKRLLATEEFQDRKNFWLACTRTGVALARKCKSLDELKDAWRDAIRRYQDRLSRANVTGCDEVLVHMNLQIIWDHVHELTKERKP